MSARAIRRVLASSPRAAGPRASANIMTYSPRTHAITSLLHDTGIVVSALLSYISGLCTAALELQELHMDAVGTEFQDCNVLSSQNSFPLV